MRYNIESTITITLSDLDHAEALKKFIEKALQIGDKGGDLELAVVDGKKIEHRQGIGHDVRCGKVDHYVKLDVAKEEVKRAQEKQ